MLLKLLLLAHLVVLVFRLERVLLPEVPGLSRSFLSCLRASQDSTVLGRGGVRYPYDILAPISISGSFCHYCSATNRDFSKFGLQNFMA